jgi:GT2 family glycosyltransferase
MVELSIIIPTLDDPEDVACRPFFERADFDDYELLVQDEAGAARARNAGIDRAAGRKLVFLDDDSYPCEGYLTEASRVLEEEVAVAGRVVHPFDDVVGRHFTGHYPSGDDPDYVTGMIGCNMCLRREVVETVGGFDEEFGWGFEEGELSYRVSKAYDVYYDPDLSVRHCYAESVFDLWRKRHRISRNRPLYWRKTGIGRGEQFLRILRTLLAPDEYRGESTEVTAVKTVANLATVTGQLRGFLGGTA